MDRRSNSLFGLVVAFTALTVTLQSHIEINVRDDQEGIIDITQRDMANFTQGNQESMEDAERINGGSSTSAKEYPWMVYTEFSFRNGYIHQGCGGSIISLGWVMSAAHCFTIDDEDDNTNYFILLKRIYIYAGVTNRKDLNDGHVQGRILDEDDFKEHLFIHPDYKKGGHEYNNDIAILKLKKPFTLTVTVKPIPLATSKDFIPGKKLIATGWGLTSKNGGYPDILQHITGLKLISRSECVKNHRYVTDKMICQKTKDKNVCTGDSGGPLVTGKGKSNGPPYVQIGISSLAAECGKYRYVADIFVDVAKFRDWIYKIMNDKCRDISSDCESYAGHGFCTTRYVAWMEINCKKTCNKCHQNGVCDGKAKGGCTKKGGSCVTKPFANNCKALHGDGGKLKKSACRSKNCQCCLPGWITVGSDKFKKFDQEISWNAARYLCRSQGLSLYKPKIFLAVAKYLDNTFSNTYYWLGAKGNGKQMLDLSGKPLTGKLPWYSSGEREDVDTDDCLYFKLNEHLQDDEVLKAGDCDKGRSVLCG